MIENGNFIASLTFVLYLEKKKLFNTCVICYYDFVKSILNHDLYKEYFNPVVFINLKICYNKKGYRFNWLPLKYMLQ